MADMANPISRGGSQWPLTILILSEGLVISLRSLHVIPTSWAVGAFFVVIVPFATLKVFTDSRQR